MDFVKDWPQYALEGEASHYLEKYKVLDDISEQTRYVRRRLDKTRYVLRRLTKLLRSVLSRFHVTAKFS